MKDEKSIWQVFPFKLNEQLSIAQLLIVFGSVIILLLTVVKCNSSEDSDNPTEYPQKVQTISNETVSNEEPSKRPLKLPPTTYYERKRCIVIMNY